jgi:hypothetical protein
MLSYRSYRSDFLAVRGRTGRLCLARYVVLASSVSAANLLPQRHTTAKNESMPYSYEGVLSEPELEQLYSLMWHMFLCKCVSSYMHSNLKNAKQIL